MKRISQTRMSSSTLFWYTQTWLSNILLATQSLSGRLLSFFSKLKAGDIIATGQYMNYQNLSNIKLRPLLENFSHSFTLTWETRAAKKPFVFSVSFVSFWCLEKPSAFIFNLKDVTRWLLRDKYRNHSQELLVNNVGEVSAHLHKLMGNQKSLFEWKYRPSCKTHVCWFAGNYCARNCRCC